MRVYIVTWNGMAGPQVFSSLQAVREEIANILDDETTSNYKPGAGFSVKIEEMSQEEFDELPEFQGY